MPRLRRPIVQHLSVAEFTIELSRKRVKNINLRASRDSELIRVSAPAHVSDALILDFVRSKLDWLRVKKTQLAQPETKIEQQFKTGATVPFLGQTWPLQRQEAKRTHFELKTDTTGQPYLLLNAATEATQTQCEQALQRLYKKQLIELTETLSPLWQEKIGVEVLAFSYRKMRSRWGSCNINKQKVTLNTELVKYGQDCVEYVLVHELIHLLERYHNKRFYSFMDRFLPDWRLQEQKLKQAL
ncbi:M48 family metallopeptidase [Agaribacterium sp. ZY112]|uniref:M48 family metallopeptidase n=1 Tax=Agaribacterium sp. ZY112 TaxID=3233574 RepID=UPI003525F272